MTEKQMMSKLVKLEKLEKKVNQLQRQTKKLTTGQRKNKDEIEKNRREIQILKRRIKEIINRLEGIGRISESNKEQLYGQKKEIDDIISIVEDIVASAIAEEQKQAARRVLTRAKKRRTQISNLIDDRETFGWDV